MSALLPIQAAGELREGIAEFLSTTFALSDNRTRSALTDFVRDPANGMFRGPFVRTRMPFEPAADSASGALEWTPSTFPFRPYVHQAQAFGRLTSRPAPDSTEPWRRPDPTLVVTGTGSGKTEAFLYPVLDHARRARAQGIRGVKALFLYPMNALATDQAERLTRLLTSEPGLAGVTAGLYTGEHSGSGRTTVSEAGLITDRATMREDPPDLLLTNYKMLDQLLLRSEDADIWRLSAHGLQYVVLDEFHTYDGAQGTDVALLLRRLGLVVGTHLNASASNPVPRTNGDLARPLGRITPVATSATLGDDGDTTAVREFARTVFGEEFPPESVLTESRLSVDQWMDAAPADRVPAEVSASPAVVAEVEAEISRHLATDRDPAEAIYQAVCTEVFRVPADSPASDVLDAVRQHELVARILEHSARAVSVSDLTRSVLPTEFGRRPGETKQFLSRVLGALSHLRATITAANPIAGRQLPSIEAHLWVRELSRLDRAVTTAPDYRWHDDGPDLGADDLGEAGSLGVREYLPAIFCRHCGRAGWMTAYEHGTEQPTFTPATIRQQSLSEPSGVRALIAADQEVRAAEANHTPLSQIRGSRDSTTSLMWLDATQAKLHAADGIDPADDTRIVPVLLHTGITAKELSERQTCPACGTRDSIRYIGSAVATLLSVALSNLFGVRGLNTADKRTLVFSDSVQDASHRAGFVQARSHAFALRTAITSALDGGTEFLDELSNTVLTRADGPVDRYHLLHPSIAERSNFSAFWNPTASADSRRRATKRVRERLLFDLCLEFGLRTTVGRTLALTGTAVPSVNAAPSALRAAARRTWEATAIESALTETEPDDAALEAWARVVVERIRQRGGITHPWLGKYLATDGNTWHLNNRGARAKGVPGFPVGGWPSFPRVGKTLAQDRYRDGTDAVASSRSWYARWTARHLGVTPDTGAKLASSLMEGLADDSVLDSLATESGATIYGIAPNEILVSAEDSPAELRCSVCHNATPAAPAVREALTGVPCLTVECSGHLESAPIAGDNYYRRLYYSSDSRSVVAREHTGLLESAERARIETQFKSAADEPGAPNVLVATPTLEMGIDIGDLSSVMLSSLPSSVASYVQRVGRAGRLTGNSLVVALVQGRGATLPVVHEPLSLINGSVQPPAAFLSAAEILRRQFIAHAIDALLLEGIYPEDNRARAVLSNHPGSFVPLLRDELPSRVEGLLGRFLGSLEGHVGDAAAADLRQWATGRTPAGTPAPHTLDSTLALAVDRWRDDYLQLSHRLDALDTVLVELQERAASPGASDQDKDDLRAAQASRKATLSQKTTHTQEYWIAALERYGLLPGYQLLDDTVDLHASVTTYDPDTLEWDATSSTFTRSVSSALTELAPGNSFYADRMRIEISSVDVGANGDALERWRVCPACSYAHTEVATTKPGACPSCGTSGFADSAQILDVVPLRKVAAQVTRDAAAVDERHDERRRRRYHVARTLAWNNDDSAPAWFVDNNGFGAQYLRRADVRWVNLGTGAGATRMIGGMQPAAPHFRVCEYCGHLDSEAGTNLRRDHRPWCPHTKSSDEPSIHVALGRALATEGVLLYLPSTVSTYDGMVMPSLVAALKLGFRRVLGGDPSHLDVATVTVPQVGKPSPALLLHDSVPGGTGYLADFTTPERVWELLHTAYVAVRDCECADANRLACPKCLLPHAHGSDADRTSRGAAETALLGLLRGTDRDDDAEPNREDWTIVTEQKLDIDGDSALEVRFRHAFQAALEAAGAKVTTKPDGKYSALKIRFPGSPLTWSMRAQNYVHEANTTPDYVLQADDPHQLKFAIYADGLKYHASAKHNRVADDAEKREALRASGWVPWAVTHADLNEYDDEGPPPAWKQQNFVKAFGSTLGIAPSRLNSAAGDPVRLLAGILTDPKPDVWRSVGHACAAYWFAAGERLKARSVHQRPYAQLVVQGHPRQPASLAAELMIDDASEAVASDDYRDDWQWWLRASNLLALRGENSVISVVTGLFTSDDIDAELAAMVEESTGHITNGDSTGHDASSSTGEAAAPSGPAPTTELPESWREIADDVDPDDPDSAAEIDLLHALAARSVPLPDYGEEVHGVIANFSWPDAKIAVFVSQSSDRVRPIAEEGWTVIDVDTGDDTSEAAAEQVRVALDAHGGKGS
ncbi:DEAD/DEAH box helicase [Dietzia sp. ANT_WB102]|uniref:DEAD/DEAH box helicase n=1 Tax=Dietzia sp. ANT_WB102 TaxID=2597345 RepID=UPI0011EBA389|nr:DEAD/DEAH box helicase [Dietzia sp. ANT_WB102]KAA0919253.1 DEAD/DEAH box helicase [Dietzia sp. ANT_WB102]